MKRNRLSALLLALVLALGLAVPVSAADLPFTDVPEGAWYRADVERAYATGLINGYDASTFGPDRYMTYAQAVKLAACMHQTCIDGAVTLENGEANWYDTYVDYARDNGIITGDYPWGDDATRAGYVEIFAQALPDEALAEKNAVADGSVPDVAADHPQAPAVYKLYRAGVLEGSTIGGVDHCFAPDDPIKRSEVSAILTRMMDESARKEFTLGELPPEEHVHSLIPTAAREADCTSSGNLAYWTCAECGKVFSDAAGEMETTRSDMTLPPLDHQFQDGVCTRCGAADPDYVPPQPDPTPTPEPTPEPDPDPVPATEPMTATISPDILIFEDGGTATFTVEVTGGVPPYSYQWEVMDVMTDGGWISVDTLRQSHVEENVLTYQMDYTNPLIMIQCTVTDSASPVNKEVLPAMQIVQ